MLKIRKPAIQNQPGYKQLEDYKLVLKLNQPSEPELWQAKPLKPEMQKFGLMTLKPVATIPATGHLTDSVLENFNQLTGALTLLNHPTIWPLLDAGNVEGFCYLVFPYDQKVISLDEQLELKPLSLPRTIDLVSQVLEALFFAHKQGVMHGSLTPSNILIQPNGQVKVCNFGIGKFDFDSNGIRLSKLAGTSPEYMAPEQFLGYGDSASDLYSAGILIYRLLVGELPFSGQHKLELSQRHLNEQVPLSNGKIPEYLQFFLARALQKEPGKRFANAQQMLKTFRQMAGSLPEEMASQFVQGRTRQDKLLNSGKLLSWQ